MSVNLYAILGHRFGIHNVLSLNSLLSPQEAPQLAHSAVVLSDLLRSGYPKLENDLNWYWHDLENTNKHIEASNLDPEKVWAIDSAISLKGPAILFISLGRASCILRTPERWSVFLTNEQIQIAIRKACYEVAQIVGSARAIYVPDSGQYKASGAGDLVYEGKPLDEIEAWLKQHYGSPASTLKEIHNAETLEADGYYVDDFGDFRGKL